MKSVELFKSRAQLIFLDRFLMCFFSRGGSRSVLNQKGAENKKVGCHAVCARVSKKRLSRSIRTYWTNRTPDARIGHFNCKNFSQSSLFESAQESARVHLELP